MTWIAEIKGRWAKATKGPWLRDQQQYCTDDVRTGPGTVALASVGMYNRNAENDLEAIANAPTDIARLVTELEEAVELIDALTDAEPCDYDSRGYCTAHALEGPDCANERALVWLERAAGR